MKDILLTEWFKLRKSKIISIILIGPLLGLITGIKTPLEIKVNSWEFINIYMIVTYALLFLPLITSVLTGFICRYEHQAGGWKQLLALPVSRGQVFVAKYVVVILLVMVIQLLFFCALIVVGIIRGFSDPFPYEMVWKSIIGGWFATLPLVALQLWLSILFNNFAVPFAINAMLTLPSILIINSERFSPYYLWVQPFLMMYNAGDKNNDLFVLGDQLMIIILGSLLFFIGGYFYFQRKNV